MTIKQIENLYGAEDVAAVIGMMGMGWNTDDTPEEIAEYHEISPEDAKSIHEIMEAIEDAMAEEEV